MSRKRKPTLTGTQPKHRWSPLIKSQDARSTVAWYLANAIEQLAAPQFNECSLDIAQASVRRVHEYLTLRGVPKEQIKAWRELQEKRYAAR